MRILASSATHGDSDTEIGAKVYLANLRMLGIEVAMTVKELHTFTDAEIETITDALRIADAHYRMLAETQSGNKDFCHILEAQARAASDLQLKIEAAK